MIDSPEKAICECRIGDSAPLNKGDRTENVKSGKCECAEYSVIGASVQGKFHKINNTHRDDSFVAIIQFPWLVAAVADGAGSRENSRYGATYCTNSLCDEILDSIKLPEDPDRKELLSPSTDSKIAYSNSETLKTIVLNSFIKTRQRLDEFAQANTLTPEDLHCTLLLVVANMQNGDIVAAQVGDGLILGLNVEQKAVPLVVAKIPDDPGATYFFTQSDWQQHFVVKAYFGEESKLFKTFYLMTDGVSNDCQYEPPQGILDKWANDIDREIRSPGNQGKIENDLTDYLENYKAPSSFDDRTLLVICRQ